MKRNRHPEDTLPAALRLKMLLSMTKKEECLLADDCELCGKVTGFTYDVMKHIAEKYSDAEVYFLIGSDKIPVLPRWHRISDFLQNFRILVAKRNGEFPEQLIEKHQFLKKYRRSFQLFEIPENLDKISSSAFRELMRAGDEQAKSMVTGEVWELLKDEKEKQMQWAAKIKSEDNIYCFRGDYDFLSNFYLYNNGSRYVDGHTCIYSFNNRNYTSSCGNSFYVVFDKSKEIRNGEYNRINNRHTYHGRRNGYMAGNSRYICGSGC